MTAVWRPLVFPAFDEHPVWGPDLTNVSVGQPSDNPPTSDCEAVPGVMKPVSRSSVVSIPLVGNAKALRPSERSDSLLESPPCGVPPSSTYPGQDFLCLPDR